VDIQLDQRSATAAASVTLPSGTVLKYEPVRYDGTTYPAAPAGRATDVFAYLLAEARTTNGYLTCYHHKHWLNNANEGRLPVVDEIRYGPALKSCAAPPSDEQTHRIELSYIDPTVRGYFSQTSHRFGAITSFNNLLTSVRTFAADFSTSATSAVQQASFNLAYYEALNSETRMPLLSEIVQQSTPPGRLPNTRTLRRFTYGSRLPIFDPTPKLLELGSDATEWPESLAGSVTRAVRQPGILGNPNGALYPGDDQLSCGSLGLAGCAAPPAHTVTREWSITDFNGDGLLDTLVADEKGPTGSWPTFENNSNPGPRPAQQWALINEGIQAGALASTKVILKTGVPALTDASLATPPLWPFAAGSPGFSRWIWQEGVGQTRTGMPLSVTSPEIRKGGNCPPGLGEDTRLWPYLPDDTFGGSEGSVGERLTTTLSRGNMLYDRTYPILSQFLGAFIPRHTISSSLSGWMDLNGDGVPDWVVTPGMIERFDLPLVCAGYAHKPEFASSSWYVAAGTPTPSVDSTGTAAYTAQPVSGPPTPTGAPLSFSTDASQSENLGITIPVGALLTTAASMAIEGDVSAAGVVAAAASIIAEGAIPRSQAGVTGGLYVSAASPTGALQQLAMKPKTTRRDLVAAAADYAMSALGINLDVVLLSGGNRGRSQARTEMMDVNADGFPDYLLYDSAGQPVTNSGSPRAGGILLYLNDGKGGFLAAQRINDGYPTNVEPMVARVTAAAKDTRDNDTNAAIARIACDAAVNSPIPAIRATAPAICQPLFAIGVAGAAAAVRTADAADAFINASADALPADQAHVTETRALAAALSGTLAGYFMPGGSAAITTALDAVTLSAELLAHAVAQVAFPSRLNMLSKGGSQVDGGAIGSTVQGIAVQTQALVDLNGDGLPDYVITRDAQKVCPKNSWEVYWGTGTANLSAGRAFTTSPECLAVPPAPAPVSNRGYATLPLQVDFIQQSSGLPGAKSTSLVHSFVALLDYNQDGRPDLLLAKTAGSWQPTDTANTWTVYLNSGRGFDLANPMTLPSVGGTLPGVLNAVTVAYPGIKTGYSEEPIIGGVRRSGSSVDVSFLDVDADGTADITQRVHYQPLGSTGPARAGLLYWSRAGYAPQDLLIEERDPLAGSRTLISYASAPRFQWKDATPDGKPPSGGHRAAIGVPPHVVRSITQEPLLGRATRRTSTGYDYKDPYFDSTGRAFLGFAQVSSMPLDTSTGRTIPGSLTEIARWAQRSDGRGGETQARFVNSATGAPAREVTHSYVEVETAPATPGRVRAYFNPARDVITTEFPDDVAHAPVLDIGFDGREPLANRADRTWPLPKVTGTPEFDSGLPTGGGVVFGGSERIELPAVPLLQLQSFTIETWVTPAGPGILVEHPDGYELSFDTTGDLRLRVKVAGSWGQAAASGPLTKNRWYHVAASYDGTTLRLFVNGAQQMSLSRMGPIIYPGGAPPAVGVGCGVGLSNCFSGSMGELRIYPDPWKSPARIVRTRTEHLLTVGGPNFGMPSKTWLYGDLATNDEDVMDELTYAQPRAGSAVQDAVSSQARRSLDSDGVTPTDYLSYSETVYDALPLGEVAAGNITRQAVYSGPTGVSTKPTADTVTLTRYKNRLCPGIGTETEDPIGATSRTQHDLTCTFALTVSDPLGHRLTREYYGVAGVGYVDPAVKVEGLYGVLKSMTEPNGATVYSTYDEWGRATATIGPYETADRPGIRTAYRDAKCQASSGVTGCERGDVAELVEPARIAASQWDGTQHDYRLSYTFGDGQVQTEGINQGARDWLVSGTHDYDTQGRVIATYKPRFLPVSAAAPNQPCPPAGTWCDSARLTGDPLRDLAQVARIQTAYDSQGRVVRVYAPNVPVCADPSATDASGALICDTTAQNAVPKGLFTQVAYPAPGVTRTVDARGVPRVLRRGTDGRVRRFEEYIRPATQPYSTRDDVYDPAGHLVEVKDGLGNTTTSTYDAMGHRLTASDPDSGPSRYEYDKRGQLVLEEDAVGARTKHAYDALGRRSRTEYIRPIETMRAYSFDGQSDDSQVSDPLTSVPGSTTTGANLWRVAPQFRNQLEFSAAPFNLEQVQLMPMGLSLGNYDNGVATIPLPFTFALTPNFTWAAYSDADRTVVLPVNGRNLWPAGQPIYVNTNGKIRFDNGGATDSGPPAFLNLPLPVGSESGLYPLWDDLVLVPGGLSFGVAGTAPNRRLIIEWNGSYKAVPNSVANFRAVLFESSYEVQYQYATLSAGAGSATIGLQNHSPTATLVKAVQYSFNAPSITSGQALTSLQAGSNQVVQFNQGTTYGNNQRGFGQFFIEVDLSDAREAELSFRHVWNTRCVMWPRGSCPVDGMTVDAEDGPRVVSVLTHRDLTTGNALKEGLVSMAGAPTVQTALPDSVMGKKVKLFFRFRTLDQGTDDPRYGWVVDDIQVRKRVLEDVVERRYDSTELVSSYGTSVPVLDLTFDVPGEILDRSPDRKGVTGSSVEPAHGKSGWGASFDGSSSYLEVDAKRIPLLVRALTVGAWVLPRGVGATSQSLIRQEGVFALELDAAGRLSCSMFAGGRPGGWVTAASSNVLPNDSWSHVAMSYDGRQIRCYVNGSEEGTQAAVPPRRSLPAPVLVIGTSPAGNAYAGLLDEVRLFAVTRPGGEILGDALSPLRHGPPRGNVLDLTFSQPQDPRIDVSAAVNNASLFRARPVPGAEGTAADFGGVPGNVIVVPNARSLQSDELTAEVWLKTATRREGLLVGKWDVAKATPGWRLALNNLSGQVRFDVLTRVVAPDAWTNWSGDTTGLLPQGNPSCGNASQSPTARRAWIAPATGTFTLTSTATSGWGPVLFVRDSGGNPIACGFGSTQATVVLVVNQAERYEVFQSGAAAGAGPFTVTASGPPVTSTSFVTLQKVNDGRWHHAAGTYDGEKLRVYIDGSPALRTCTSEEGGDELTCRRLPIERCSDETRNVGDVLYGTATCAQGTIINKLPVYAGSYGLNSASLEGLEDEIRISNYAKRDFEVAGSARPYAAYASALGHEVERRNSASSEYVSRDLLGRTVSVFKQTRIIPAAGSLLTTDFTMREATDNLGRSSALRYPDGEVTVAAYDRVGTQIALTGYGVLEGPISYGKQPYLMGAAETPTGRLSQLKFGNGAMTDLVYDDGRTQYQSGGTVVTNSNGTFGNELLIELTTRGAGSAILQRQSYRYDAVANLERRKDSLSTPLHAAPLEAAYGYDDLNRLTTFDARFGGTLAAAGTYGYDPMGNLTTKEGAALTYGISGGASNCGRATAGVLPHAVTLLSVQGSPAREYCYDANGRIREIRSGTTTTATFTHDVSGNITKIQNQTGLFRFTYDANGNRVHKIEPAGLTTQAFPMHRLTPSGVEKYYLADGRLIARRVGNRADQVFWYHPEHLGGTNIMTSMSGDELQDSYSEYMPFGSALSNSLNNTGGNQYQNQNTPDATSDRSGGFQFSGKELDDSGLYYYGARYYDPQLGRFLQPDPAYPGPSSQHLNRYSYVLNNPLRYVDPTGSQEVRFDKFFEKLSLEERAKFMAEAAAEERLHKAASADATEGDYVTPQEGLAARESLLRHSVTHEPLVPPLPPLQYFREKADENPFSKVPFIRAGWLLGEALWGETITGIPVSRGAKLLEAGLMVAEDWMTVEMVMSPFEAVASWRSAWQEAEIMSAINEGRHVMFVDVWRGNELVRSTHFISGESMTADLFRHTETEFAQQFWRQLQPGDEVILQGFNPICKRGFCHGTLDALSRITGADITYYAHVTIPSGLEYTSMRSYLGGEGFMSRKDLLRYLKGQ
jgi:RHS repeat-associated protein